RHLGDPLRWPEIFELNEGRPQPDGGCLTDAGQLAPGWRLLLPADARLTSTANATDAAGAVGEDEPAATLVSSTPSIDTVESAMTTAGPGMVLLREGAAAAPAAGAAPTVPVGDSMSPGDVEGAEAGAAPGGSAPVAPVATPGPATSEALPAEVTVE